MSTRGSREPRLHLFNHHTGKSLCGRAVERYGPWVTTDTIDVNCGVCGTELRRITSAVSTMVDDLGGKVFRAILEDAGAFARLGGE